MAGPVETSGSIETFCQRADTGHVSRGSAYSFDRIMVGDRVAICFAGEDTKPPYALRVRGPAGNVVLERLLRELPTGLPQSEPPVHFVVSAPGVYVIEIREHTGQAWGRAQVRVT